MTLRTPLSQARGLGSAHAGAHHWWHQRITAVAMFPLMIWFVMSLAAHVGADYFSLKAWMSSPINATLMIALMVNIFYHANLGLQVVIEDYVQCPAMKTVSLILIKLLATLFALFSVVNILEIAIGS